MNTLVQIVAVVGLAWVMSVAVCAVVDELWYRSTH